MRIGTISDIHANLNALQRAFRLFETLHVETILCAGDLVDIEPDADAVVDLMRRRSIPCVRGNHDQEALEYQAWIRKAYALDDPRIKEDLFSQNTIDYLAALPLTQFCTFGDTRVLVAHGVPWRNTFYLFPDNPPEQFEEVALEAQADVVILGHTHVPMCVHVNNTWIVNPGSVDGNRPEDNQTCAVIDLSPFAVQVFDINTHKIVRTCG